MNRRDFQTLARIRLEEAGLLLQHHFYDGAYYLCGYVVECGLKACIARQIRRHDFPPEPRVVSEMYTHDLEKLVGRAGLRSELSNAMSADGVFQLNCTLVRDWSERSRYERRTATEAQNIYQAVTDRRHGVLRWIR